MFNAVAELPPGYTSLFDQYVNIAIHIAKADGRHFLFQGFVNTVRGWMIHT